MSVEYKPNPEDESVEELESPRDEDVNKEEELDVELKGETVAKPSFIPEEVVIREERVYTIPLWRSWISGRGYRRANKAVRYLVRFISRHMRSVDIKVSPKVNEIIWSRGIRNPPRRIKVKVVLGSDQVVYVLPVDEDVR